MMIFKRAIPRRTFLRGLGTAIALPLLDAMVPAFASAAEGSNATGASVRLSTVYVPNGIIMEKWTPAAEGASYELTPILEPLAPFKDRILLITGLAHKQANSLPNEAGGMHPRAGAVFLTGVHPKMTEGADMEVGVSMDQIAARQLGQQTQIASIEIGLDSPDVLGVCETGYSCAYTNTLSWRAPQTPMPIENHPRAVFERLFGDSETTDKATRQSRFQEDRSVLDWVRESVTRLSSGLGQGDRARLAQYTDAIRDVERRIQVAEKQTERDLPTLERPVGVPPTYAEHANLMFDLQVIAFQSDMTRVITFMMSREQGSRAYPEIGVTDPHHPLTHHQGDPDKVAKVAQINAYHAKLFSGYLERLRSTPDGNGSLLDHMLILYGCGMSDGNIHQHENLPLLLTGGTARKLGPARHVRVTQDTPMSNLLVTMLDLLNVPVEKLGDSTGKLELPAKA